MNTSTVSPFRSAGTSRPGLLALLLAGIVAALTPAAFAQVQAPTLSLSLAPEDIGPGSCTELTFTITNPLSVVATNVAFSLDLPAGVVLATPANPVSDCDGTVTAPNGGSMIALNAGRVSANSTCTLKVGLTGSTNGTFTLTTSALTTSAGSSGAASIDLNVHEFSRPGFTKAFSPNPIGFSGRSTLTYTLENNNEVTLSNLTFSDTLPTGVAIAGPANVSTDCQNAAVTAVPGTSTISLAPAGFGLPMLGPGSCTISVDVIGTTVGANNSISSDLTFSSGPQGQAESAGRACAILNVLSPGTLQLTKSFLDDPVAPGGTTTLQFTLTNLDRSETATNISFTDDLDATLSGLTALDLPANDLCGIGSSLSGISMLTFSGGTLAAGESCTFSVQVNLPSTVDTGSYPNTTSTVTGDAGGRQVTGGAASDSLFVAPIPTFTKSFTDDPVGAGDTVTLEYTITNTSTTSELTGLAFTEVLDDTVPGITISGALPTNPCGAGSTLTFIPAGQFSPAELRLSGGNLPAGASCTFSVVLQLPTGISGASYPSTSGPLTGTIEDSPVTAPGATDDLVVVPPVSLVKEFTDDPVLPGETVTLEFTLSNTGEGAADATNISFTDDLEDTLEDLTAIGLPLTNICGAGSSLTASANDTLLTFSGGTLLAGETCTFSVTLQLHPNTDQFTYTNTTSEVTATVSGVATTGNAASANLIVGGLSISKEFIDDPAIPGQTAILAFTVTNEASADATNITFTDDLDDALSGLTATGTPPLAPCGPGSSVAYAGGNSVLVFTGGSVAAGTSCSFQVTVAVPTDAPDGAYRNVTGSGSATIGGGQIALDPAFDDLVIDSSVLSLRKEFTDDPVAPGDTATLEFTLTNLSASQTINQIAFTDDLGAALSGLVAVGLPANDVCGPGSQISGTDLLTFTGGSLAPGASCTFSVTLQVPAAVPLGTVVFNTTSAVTGNVGVLASFPVDGSPARANLLIESLRLTKSFDGPAAPGATAVLTFLLENLGSAPVTDLAFTDNLNAVLPGLVATGLPVANACGAGSQLAGTSIVTLSNGSLGGNESCTFNVTVQIPANATSGSYPNTTGDLMISGVPVASPATADLEIIAGLNFSKAFVPSSIGQGQTSTLTFTLDNSGAQLDATGVDFTDTLPAGLVIATPSNATTTCVGGTLTAAAGGGTISYSGGTVPGGTTCTVSVDVVANSVGTLINTSGPLASSLGASPPASANLVVNPQPGFAKVFAPDSIDAGRLSTLTFTIDNSGSTVDATALDFTDSLPAGLVVAPAPNATTTCVGGTLTALPGSGTISYTGGTVPAGSSCTLSVDVTTVAGGVYLNTSGDLTSSLGNSGTAADTLTVRAIVSVSLTKTESADPVVAGSGPGNLTYTITATNGGPSVATGVTVSEVLTLPAGVTIDSITPSAGTFTDPIWNIGTLPAGASETLTVVLTVDATAAPGTDVISDTASLESVNETNLVDGEVTVTESTSIANEVDITLSISESVDPVVAGSGAGNLTYVVTARNLGPSDATGVVVVNGISLPPFVTLDSITESAGTSFAGNNWTIGDLAAGASATLTAVLTVGELAPEGGGTISDTASVNAVDQPDINVANNTITESTSIANEVDLAITKADSIDPVIAGSGPGNLVHTVTVTNAGPSAARNAIIQEAITLPAGVTIDSIVPSIGSYAPANAPNGNWTLSLPPGDTATLTVTFTVAPDAPNNGTIVNTATFGGLDGTDTNPANDSATEETTILAGVDLVVTKTESIDPVIAGSGTANLTYVITVTNNGPLDATGVAVTEQLSFGAGIGVESFTPSVGILNGVVWEVGNLANGASETLTVVLTVGPSAPAGTDTITNTASVSAVDQPQINPGDESATVSTSVAREVDFVVTVSESRDPVLAGSGLPGNLKHTVTVINLGPSDASGVVLDITPVIPGGVTVDSGTADRGIFDVDEWDIGSLARGESLDLILAFSVPTATPGGVDTISTTGAMDDWNETILNTGDDSAAVSTSVVSPASISLVAGAIELDLQSALFKQTLTITNNNPLAVPGFRVLVNGLPADVSVFNAQGEAGGASFLLYNQALAANGSVDLVVEYFQEGAAGGFAPTFTIELLDPAAVQPSPEGAGLERIVALANGDILIEFSSTPGTSYTIQYSHDGVDWFDVIPSVTAGATRTQWIDNGPPKTPTHPSVTPTRLYRVVTDGN